MRLSGPLLAGLPTLRFVPPLLFGLLAAAGCQPERTPDQALDHILAQPQFTVWLDSMHLTWAVRVEPSGSGRVVNTWQGGHPFERRRDELRPTPNFAPVRYTVEHEALIRQIVAEAGVDPEADEFDAIRWGLEGGGERLVLARSSPRLDSLSLRLMNLGR